MDDQFRFCQPDQSSDRLICISISVGTEVSLRITSLDYLGLVASRLRRDAVQSRLKLDTIDTIIQHVKVDTIDFIIQHVKVDTIDTITQHVKVDTIDTIIRHIKVDTLDTITQHVKVNTIDNIIQHVKVDSQQLLEEIIVVFMFQ